MAKVELWNKSDVPVYVSVVTKQTEQDSVQAETTVLQPHERRTVVLDDTHDVVMQSTQEAPAVDPPRRGRKSK